MSKRKILVFAHVPPPHHGQSVMVQIILEGLRADPRFEVHHVDARVSDDLEDVGSFRPKKFIRLFKCILQAWWIRLRHGRMAFYYVPAPAKRSAVMRDWVVMALCRPWFPELILHWHAYGLGEWVAAGKDWQRKLTCWALGKADLSIVLNNYNKRDAAVFEPKRIEVVPNGIADQFPDYESVLAPRREARAGQLRELSESRGGAENAEAKMGEWEGEKVGRLEGGGVKEQRHFEKLEKVRFLYLGHLIESKGVFVAIEATGVANEELRRAGAGWRAHLTLAGSFASEEDKKRVMAAVDKVNGIGHGLKKIGEDKRLDIGDGRLEIGDGGAEGGDWRTESEERRTEVGEGAGKVAGGEAPCVELAGFLRAEQKKSALEEADCLVFPTFYEGETQGLVLLEAMSAGLPVITTSWRGVPEALPEGYEYVVEPQNVQEMAQAIESICLGVSASHLLRELYQEKYTVERHVAKLAEAMLVG